MMAAGSSNPRQALIQEMGDTLAAYHALLDAIPPEALELPTANPTWNVRQVLYHMSMAPRFMLADVRMITGYTRQHRWLYRAIERLVPEALFHWLNERYTRWGARKATHSILRREYERAHTLAKQALAAVGDEQFEMALHYPGWDPMLSGVVTVERLFHYIKNHFEAHAGELRKIAAAQGPAEALKSRQDLE